MNEQTNQPTNRPIDRPTDRPTNQPRSKNEIQTDGQDTTPWGCHCMLQIKKWRSADEGMRYCAFYQAR